MRPVDVSFDRSVEFDLIVASCGYERRSSYLCRLGVDARAKVALEYGGPSDLTTSSNRGIYSAAGWELVGTKELTYHATQLIANCLSPRICIDISSMPRAVLAALVEWLWDLPMEDAQVQFVYCPAQFASSSQAAARVGTLSAGPVSDFFIGELRAPSVPVGLIVGLGLEPHRALGLVELVEPLRTWAFVSESIDHRFSEAASALHADLLASPDAPTLLHYDVRSLAQTYGALESLNFAVGLNYRLLIAPSGPKIFSLACMLVGAPRVNGRPAIWRVGNAIPSAPSDVAEAGDVVAADVHFGELTRKSIFESHMSVG